MTSEVHLVLGEAGQWDSYHTWRVAVYAKPEDAARRAAQCQEYGTWFGELVEKYYDHDRLIRDQTTGLPAELQMLYDIVCGPYDETEIYQKYRWFQQLLPVPVEQNFWQQMQQDEAWALNPFDLNMARHEHSVNYFVEVLPLDPVVKEPAPC